MCFRRPSLVCAAVAVLLLATTPAVAGAATTSCVPPPVAHRGDSHRAPENTRPAFASALRGGVRILELDVHFAAGGTPVVIHDATVDRTTDGSGSVRDMSLSALRALDAGSWFSPTFAGTRVPTVYEVLRDGVPYGARYLVDLKARPSPSQLQGLLRRFDGLRVRHRIVVTSRDPATLDDVRAIAPDLRTALVDHPVYRDPSTVLRYGNAYVVSHRVVTSDHTLSLRQSGIEVYSWTVDSLSGWSRMSFEQVAGTITNRPVRYLAWARSVCG